MALRQVSKRYPGAAPVLDRVDLIVRAGELVAVTGGNGSGKSTLLRIVAGLSTPTAGTISGRPRLIGYVPERFPSQQRMPARSYLVHMGRIRGLRTRRARSRAMELLDRLELVGGAGTPLRNLSKGNAQKIAVAQALLVPPDLLVLDEPWSGLDASAHQTLGDLIAELAADGGRVIFTDHREAVVGLRASVTYRLERGRLTAAAPASAAVEQAHVVLVATGAHHSTAELEWRRLPGVRSVRHTGRDAVSIQVADQHCDGLLITAIRAGWSVQRVERTEPALLRGARR
jgi:ABC-type multidrug transport system ATPase subunit